MSSRKIIQEVGGQMEEEVNFVKEREANLNYEEFLVDIQPAKAPARARRRKSTKGIGRPGYRRRISTPHSYVELISMAIKSSPHCMLTLREIIAHLEKHNECFQGSYVGWKNSVRHNLSSSRCFLKLLRNSNRPFAKDNFWAMNPDSPHCQEAQPPDWQCDSPVDFSRLPESSTHQLTPCVSPLQTSNDMSFVPEPLSWQSSGNLPGVLRVYRSVPSPILDDQPIESALTVLPAGASVLPPKVVIDQPVEPASPHSSIGDDSSVQLLPLDLSMHTLSKDRFPSKATESSNNQPSSSVAPGLDLSNCAHHNLPVSRFLNAPDDDTCRDYSPVRHYPESPVAVTNQDAHNARNASYFSRVPPYAMRQSPCLDTSCSAAARPYIPSDHVPRDDVPTPRTPEEVRVFESLYEHYWNQALKERETLQRQAEFRSWYQYPVVCANSDRLSGCTPASLGPNSDCLERPTNSWFPMQCVPFEEHINYD